MNADWLTVLPPLVAIAFVLWRREVIVALVLAVFTSELLLQANVLPGTGLAFIATLERTAAVFSDADNARILMFSILIGALIAYMKYSGGRDRAGRRGGQPRHCAQCAPGFPADQLCRHRGFCREQPERADGRHSLARAV